MSRKSSVRAVLPPQLEAASIIAPVVRSMVGRKRIYVVDRETGEVKETIDDQTLVVRMLERKGIEFGVERDPGHCLNWPRCKSKIGRSTLWRARKDGREFVECRACLRSNGATRRLPKCTFPECTKPMTIGSYLELRRRPTGYCDVHSGGRTAARAPMPCCIPGCRNPSTRLSSKNARLTGGRPFCHEHARGVTARAQCAICGAAATPNSIKGSRNGRRCRAYCGRHKNGADSDGHRVARLPCAVCGAQSTDISHRNAKKRGTKAYCAAHKRRR